MHHNKEHLIALLASKGWSKPLIDATFELVGGFDALAEHTNVVWPMIFANSLGNQIEIEEDDGSDLLAAIKVLNGIKELSDNNMIALNAYLDTHSDDMLLALRTQFDEPAARLTTISDFMLPEEADIYITTGQLEDEYKQDMVNIMVYYACYWLTEISGGLNTDRLALIDLSESTSVNLFNGQISVESKPKEKNARFIGTLEELYEVCDNYYIQMFWGGTGKKRVVTGIYIKKKEPLTENIPVHINLKKLSSVVTRGSCFVEISMISTSKSVNDQDLLCLTDDTVAKINVQGSHELELIMSENAVLDLSGNVVSGSARIEDQSRLIALDFTADNIFSCHRLDEDSRVFANSANFYVERQIDDAPSNFANKAADEFCDEHIGYLRKQRMEE